MKMFVNIRFLLFLILLIVNSCKPPVKNNEDKKIAPEQEEISLLPLTNLTTNEDAILSMNEPGEYKIIPAGKTGFTYEVVNFKLGKDNNQNENNNLKNSMLGQHITLILNNESNFHFNKTQLNIDLKPAHYIALTFLTLSNYISIKDPEAYVMRQFDCGDKKPGDLDLTGPNLFYYMPSGSYVGPGRKNILLDFFLVNCKLSETGLHVKVKIKNNEFIINEWTPFIIRGLPDGESIIEIGLTDKNGNPVKSTYNSASRRIFLSEREQE